MERMYDRLRTLTEAVWRVRNPARNIDDDNVPCQIEEGLFLGSLGAAENKNALKSNNITHILSVLFTPPLYPDDFVYKVVSVRDKKDTNIRQYFDECFKFIDDAREQGAGVFVHCFVGKSRSATIIIAYLMKKHGMSLAEALQHVKSRRPRVSPNSGFISQLRDFEKSLPGYFQNIPEQVRVPCREPYGSNLAQQNADLLPQLLSLVERLQQRNECDANWERMKQQLIAKYKPSNQGSSSQNSP